jgi:hypothetical protein
MGNGYSISNGFCTVEDDKKKQYILTDKNKQPLYCLSNLSRADEQLLPPGTLFNGTCRKDNYKKYLDNPALANGKSGENFFFNEVSEDQFIQCSSHHKKQFMGLGDTKYNEQNFSDPIPKSNINFNNYDIASFVKDTNKDTNSEQVSGNFNPNPIDLIKSWNNYFQKSLIREDARIIDPNAPAPDTQQINYKFIGLIGLCIFIIVILVFYFFFR